MSPARGLTGGPGATLERCPTCRSRLAYPVSWRRLADDVWEISLRCPDCRGSRRERVPTQALRRLDRVMHAGRRLLERHLEEIERLEREAEADSFAAALAVDAILPEDFGRPA